MAEGYFDAMDKVKATEDWTARTLAALEERNRRPVRRPGRLIARLGVAAAVCAALLVTAVAVSPGLREALLVTLGNFAPYAQEVDGVSATDQGIEIRAISALSDGNTARVYLEVRDRTGDRLGEDTELTVAMAQRPEADYETWSWTGAKAVSYDAETKTALVRFDFNADGVAAVGGTLELTIDGVYGGMWHESGRFDESLLTEATLETMTLDTGETVLMPEQTPAELEGTALAELSSIGFGTDGRLHIQLRCDGKGIHVPSSTFSVVVNSRSAGETVESRERYFRYTQDWTEVRFQQDGVWYMDRCYQITQEDLPDLLVGQVSILAADSPAVEGNWALTVPLEDVPHRRIQMEETVGDITIRALDITALGLSAECVSADGMSLQYSPALYLADGTICKELIPGGTFYLGSGDGSEDYTYSRWDLQDPIDPEQVVGVSFGLWYIPIEGETAGPGCWLETLP